MCQTPRAGLNQKVVCIDANQGSGFWCGREAVFSSLSCATVALKEGQRNGRVSGQFVCMIRELRLEAIHTWPLPVVLG